MGMMYPPTAPAGDGTPSLADFGLDGEFLCKARMDKDGVVTAKVASLGVLDTTNQIIDPQAVTGEHKVRISDWGHSSLLPVWFSPRPPVGKGVVITEGNALMLTAQLFMDTPDGKAAFNRLRAIGRDQQWSIGYRYLADPVYEERRVKGKMRTIVRLPALLVDECSPVLRGASPRTRTTGTKSDSGVAPVLDAPRHRVWVLERKWWRIRNRNR